MTQRSASIVVVGSINVDHVVRVERRPAAGETVGNGTLELHSGGKGANQAAAAARCGATVAMVGRVGDDGFGSAQRAELTAEGVDVQHVVPTEGVPTGLAIVLLTPDGENSIVVVPGANGCLVPADMDAAGSALRRANVLVAQLEVPLDAVRRAVELCGQDTVVVLNWAPFHEPAGDALYLFEVAGVLVVNEHEASALAGRPVRGPSEAFDAAREIVEMGPRSVVVTLGQLGAVFAGSGGRGHVVPEAVEVVDTTGAGDAFVGALAACLARGSDLAEAVRFGVVVGSATTTRTGARAVVPPELLQFHAAR
jgi:ribokinase